jgi:hypothetical protein
MFIERRWSSQFECHLRSGVLNQQGRGLIAMQQFDPPAGLIVRNPLDSMSKLESVRMTARLRVSRWTSSPVGARVFPSRRGRCPSARPIDSPSQSCRHTPCAPCRPGCRRVFCGSGGLGRVLVAGAVVEAAGEVGFRHQWLNLGGLLQDVTSKSHWRN